MFLSVFYQLIVFRIDSLQKYGSVLFNLQEKHFYLSRKKNSKTIHIEPIRTDILITPHLNLTKRWRKWFPNKKNYSKL